MSTPDPLTPIPPAPSGTDGFFDSVRRTGLVRTRDRWIGGVGGGIARRLGIDPLLVRGLFLVSVLLGGLGLVLYAVGWLLLPEQDDGRIHLQELFRGHADIAVLGAALLLVSGLTTTGGVPGWYWGDSGWWRGLVWLGVIVTVVALLASRRSRRSANGPTTSLPTDVRPPAAWPTGPAPSAGAAPVAGSTPGPSGPTTWTSAAPTEGPSMSTTPTAPGAPTTGHPSPTTEPGAPTGRGPAPTGYGQSWAGYDQSWTAPRGVPTTALPTTTLPPATPRGPRGAGRGALGIVVALTLLVLAGLLLADRTGQLAAPVGLTTVAAAVVFLGVAIVVAGLRGRTAGGLGALAVVLMLVAAPLAASDRYDWQGQSGQVVFGDISERPLSVTRAEQGYQLGAGTARIDLTALPESSGEVLVPIDLAAGDLTVIVPSGADVTAEIDLAAGELSWFGERTERGFGGDTATLTHAGTEEGAGPDIVLNIDMGVGSLTVTESGR